MWLGWWRAGIPTGRVAPTAATSKRSVRHQKWNDGLEDAPRRAGRGRARDGLTHVDNDIRDGVAIRLERDYMTLTGYLR